MQKLIHSTWTELPSEGVSILSLVISQQRLGLKRGDAYTRGEAGLEGT